MKKLTIGRGRECDVRIEDSTDLVSRRQAVLRFSFFGKIEIFDLSSNGTFVNGETVEKPNGHPVKRGDQVNFAHVVDLDWSKVKDPYRTIKISLVFMIIAVIVAIVLCLTLPGLLKKEEVADEQNTEQTVTNTADTIAIPEQEEIPGVTVPAVQAPSAKETNPAKREVLNAVKEGKEKGKDGAKAKDPAGTVSKVVNDGGGNGNGNEGNGNSDEVDLTQK